MTALPFIVISLASAGAAPQGVLLDFMSTSCRPCMEMSPIVEKLHREGAPVRQVNVVENRDMAQKYNITMIPTFVVVVNGREVNRIEGSTSESNLRRLVAQIPVVPDSQLAAAEPKSKGRKNAEKKSIAVDEISDGGEKKGFSIPLIGGLGKKKSGTNVIVEREKIEDPFAAGDNETARQKKSSEGPIASTVRIRVNDKAGCNFGSGSIIESRPGRTTILTCGHIFRGIDQGGKIEVDVFRDGGNQTFPGKVIKYNLKAEVGLLSIDSPEPLPVVKIAGLNHNPMPGDHVTSIGCGGGDMPTIEAVDVTRLNRYEAPDNIECTGQPVPGRSGGGLFNRANEIVGVCFASDPDDRRGLYCGLQPIHELLDACSLTSLYENAAPENERQHVAVASAEGDRGAIREVSARTDFAAQEEAAQGQSNATENGEAVAGLDESEDAEIVCIIRPLNNPQDASRVVIINRASPKFVHYLQGELRSQTQPTSAHVPHEEKSLSRRQKKSTHKDADDDRETAGSDRPLRPAVMRVANRPSTGASAAEPQSEEPHRYQRSSESRGR